MRTHYTPSLQGCLWIVPSRPLKDHRNSGIERFMDLERAESPSRSQSRIGCANASLRRAMQSRVFAVGESSGYIDCTQAIDFISGIMRLLWQNAASVASFDHKLTTDFLALISSSDTCETFLLISETRAHVSVYPLASKSPKKRHYVSQLHPAPLASSLVQANRNGDISSSSALDIYI